MESARWKSTDAMGCLTGTSLSTPRCKPRRCTPAFAPSSVEGSSLFEGPESSFRRSSCPGSGSVSPVRT
eukprot:scaffold826_cov335-Pavlova_lutheri.AAC.10